MFTEEFNDMPEAMKEKVAKKIGKIYRWIEHSGGWTEEMAMAHSYVVFKAFEDMGFDVVLKPRTAEAEKVIERAEQGTIVLTDE